MHCGSQSAIQLVHNLMFHAKMKHVEVKYRFIRKVLDDKCIQLIKVHTDDNLVDLPTKSLNLQRFAHCRGQMGVG